jgi:hypothetical protein
MKLLLLTLLFCALPLAAQYVPSDAERARWTLHDMRSWKIALEAYKSDRGVYPAGNTLADAARAVNGTYIAAVPMHDAWGRAYVYEKTESGFILVSGGADGTFDRSSWAIAGKQQSFDADAVIDGQSKFWLRSWEMK